jgi:hypothetical protein
MDSMDHDGKQFDTPCELIRMIGGYTSQYIYNIEL